MIEELDDSVEFDAELKNNRHKEVISSLKEVLLELKKDKSNPNIEKAIAKQSEIISVFIEAMKSINPQVSVETNQHKVIASFEDTGGKIIEALKELKKSIDDRPKELEFKINRNLGVIQGGTILVKE